jgi:hypothetical protein
VVSASSNIGIVGLTGTITSTTGTVANVTAGCASNCANANKNWADDTVVTHVFDAAGNDVTGSTSVAPGTVVHDVATVAAAPGTPSAVPAPTGTVTFTLFPGGNCTGTPVANPNNNPDTETLSGGTATSVTFTTPAGGGSFSYLAHYNGQVGVYPPHDAVCEPFTVATPFTANFTPGFWKNHAAATSSHLPLTLGNFKVTSFAVAQQILEGMGCGSQGALNCMAGMLLAAKLNLAQGGNTCIVTNGTIAAADALLIKYGYNGPGTYTLTPDDQTKAITLHDALSAYNIDGVPTC